MTISNNTSSWVGEKGLENCSRKSLLVEIASLPKNVSAGYGELFRSNRDTDNRTVHGIIKVDDDGLIVS